MNQTRRRGRAAAIVAVIIAAASLTQASGGRKLAAALGSALPADMSATALRRHSTALRRHLKINPRDRLAAQLLNAVDTEIIIRANAT